METLTIAESTITYEVIKASQINKPDTSIVIPFYKSEETIKRALTSALTQNTSIPFNVIIVDDGNATPVSQYLHQLIKDSRVSILRQENQGVSTALNLGVLHSNAKRIIRLDADDELTPEAVQIFKEYFDADPELSYGYSDGYWMGPLPKEQWNWMKKAKLKEGKKIYEWNKDEFDAKRLTKEMYLGHARCYTKEVFLQVGGYNKKFSGSEDKDFAIKVSEVGKIQRIPHKLHKYYLLDSGITATHSEEDKTKRDHMIEKERQRRQNNGR